MRTTRWLLTTSVVAAVGMWFAACDDDPISATPPGGGGTERVVLSQASATLKPGEKVTLTAQPQRSDGVPLDRQVTWTSSNVAVATVAPTGAATAEVSAIAFGTVTITAATDGKSATAAVEVLPLGTIVTNTGATITSADGKFTISIPAGALEQPTDVVVTKVDVAAAMRMALAARYAGGPGGVMFAQSGGTGDPVYIPGTGYQVEPMGQQLKLAATLRIQYDPASVPGDFDHQQLRIQYRERTQQQDRWHECDHTGVNGNAVEASTNVLTMFGLYGRPNTRPQAAIVNVTPSSLDLEEGDVVQLSAQVLDEQGTLLDVPVTWSVDNPAVATVDATGKLTALVDGSTSVTATAGGKQGSAGVRVNRKVGSVSIGAPPADLIEGEVIQLVANVLDSNGGVISGASVTWTSLTPSVATVDQSGNVTGVSAGDATIVASARGKSDTLKVTVGSRASSVTVTPSSATVGMGGTVTLVAEVRDATGTVVDRQVSWKSSATAIATVNNGVVTGVAPGSATITATSQQASGSAAITVSYPAATITISGNSTSSLKIGDTRQLTATAYDASGQPVSVTITWKSSSDAIATVSSTGLVTAVAAGTASITASAGQASASVSVSVTSTGGGEDGGETETLGNNMSWPVVFSNGIGITGLTVATDPGVRPLSTETAVADTTPFWWSGNVADYDAYFTQGSANTWRAQFIDGTGQSAYDTEVQFGDNLFSKVWSASRPIRVEVALNATGAGTLKGFNMFLLSGEGSTELQGADGTTGDFVPLIYLPGCTLTVERISGVGGSVLATVFSGDPSTELNGAGRIIWGYQLKVSDWTPPTGVTLDGWYRLRFTLPTEANATVTGVYQGESTAGAVASVVNTREARIDIQIAP